MCIKYAYDRLSVLFVGLSQSTFLQMGNGGCSIGAAAYEGRDTGIQTDGWTCRQTEIQAARQTGKQSGTHARAHA